MRLFGFGKKDDDKIEGALDTAAIEQDEKFKKMAQDFQKRYKNGVAYMQAQGFFDDWAEYQRFYEADQWPDPTLETEDMPRPVTNWFASTIDQLVAGVTYEAPDIFAEPVETAVKVTDQSIFLPAREGQDQIEDLDIDAAELVSAVIKQVTERAELESLIESGAKSGALLGNGIWWIPWDQTITGGGAHSRYIGDVAIHEVDPADFMPDDPGNQDIQSQTGITLAERRPLKEVKDFYRQFAGDLVDTLQPERNKADTQIYDHQMHQMDEAEDVNIIHRWWKEAVEEDEYGGQKAVLRYGVECQEKILRYDEEHYQHGLYPFASFCWKPRRKSFWGIPESKNIIANQKEDNRLAGITLMGAYMAGLPNIRFHPEYVDEQDIPAGPGGGIIKDNTPGGGVGINYMNPPTPAAHIPQVREALSAGIREISGVHEAWSGKAPSAQLNASAIIALQEAAGVRIRGIVRRLNKSIREIGEIIWAHIKEFYEEARLFRLVGGDKMEGFFWFRGTDYADMEFDVRVQSGNASPYAKTLYMATLDKLLESGVITGDEYLEYLPADAFPKAQKLLEDRQERMLKQQEELAMQQIMLVGKLVDGVVAKAQQTQTPIDPQAVSQMLSIAQNIAGLGQGQAQQQQMPAQLQGGALNGMG